MVNELESNVSALRISHEDKACAVERLEQALKDSKANAEVRENGFYGQIDLLRKEKNDVCKDHESSEKRICEVLTQLEAKTDEKDLLQTRHDALTSESESLQKELSKARAEFAQLHGELERERVQWLQSERSGKQEHKNDTDNLSKEISKLQRLLDAERQEFRNQEQSWMHDREALIVEKESLESKLATSHESALTWKNVGATQSMHDTEVHILLKKENERQQAELNALVQKCKSLEFEGAQRDKKTDALGRELFQAREKIKDSAGGQGATTEKLQALEDEIEILQSVLEENANRAQRQANELKNDANDQLQEIKANHEAAEVKVMGLQKELQTMQEQKTSLQIEMEQLKAQYSPALTARSGNAASKVRKQQESKDPTQLRNQFQQKIERLEMDCAEHEKNREASEKTVTRLQKHIRDLESDLRATRALPEAEDAMALERSDLHDMIKSAKLEAEELQTQLRDREARAAASTKREQKLRVEVQRLRRDRNEHERRSNALSEELEALQSRYERKVDELAEQWRHQLQGQQVVTRRAQKPSIQGLSNNLQSEEPSDTLSKEKKHVRELKGMAKQIEYLRAKCKREQSFRDALAYEKRYLLMQIDMFQAW